MNYPCRFEFRLKEEQSISLKELAKDFGFDGAATFLRAIADRKLIVTRS